MRVILASQAAPIQVDSRTLGVEYTDFDVLIARHRTEQLTVDDYVPLLLQAALSALLNALCSVPPHEGLTTEYLRERNRRAARAADIHLPARLHLAHLIRRFHPALLRDDMLYERLHALEHTFTPTWHEFTNAAEARQLSILLEKNAPDADAISHLLVHLNDYSGNAVIDSPAPPTASMAAFVHMARLTGFNCVQFLIDRLDEHAETADSPAVQADMLEPLLAHLPLLEMSGLTFKFFLSREARDVLVQRPTIRRDRLTDQAVTIEWRRDRLKRLLDERLSVYSDGQIHDLLQLCSDTMVETERGRSLKPLGVWIEDEAMQLAQGSPRRLLVALQLLCLAHVRQSGASGLIQHADREVAKQELLLRMPPLLQLYKEKRSVRIGDREETLTSQEQRILAALAESHGLCQRETLIQAVCRSGDQPLTA